VLYLHRPCRSLRARATITAMLTPAERSKRAKVSSRRASSRGFRPECIQPRPVRLPCVHSSSSFLPMVTQPEAKPRALICFSFLPRSFRPRVKGSTDVHQRTPPWIESRSAGRLGTSRPRNIVFGGGAQHGDLGGTVHVQKPRAAMWAVLHESRFISLILGTAPLPSLWSHYARLSGQRLAKRVDCNHRQ
jgi:hypothetical protein